MKILAKLSLSYVILIIVFLSACKNDSENPLPEAKFLVKAELIREISANEIKNAAASVPGFPSLYLGLFTNDIRVYKITYKTPYLDGITIEASGALLVPKSSSALPILSLQHGTLLDPIDEASAPSYFANESESQIPGALFASAGYVVLVPDYIGYGASKAKIHPYEHAQSLATACRDMLQAGKEYCERNGVNLNNKIFLAGYSEGGFATMALLKHLEENPISGIKITACAPGAGAYHKTRFAEYIVNSTTDLNFLPTYLWVMDTYNRIYNINRPYNQLFNEPYATTISQNGIFANNIPKNPQTLFKADFIAGVKNGTDTQFINAFAQNNIYDWQPTAPLNLFHGTADDYVLFFNSQDAFDAMKARGATQVELTRLEGKDHFTGAVEYYLQTFSYFFKFK
ncbi:MAG: alpha/beta fold hydrolase [Microscillaceae bacterium]|jgi:pimeloyl-ACP methyl ester carboxylesterase|nr:alpha/beta fold hydrolase [Microscillaceae bacterium]